MQSVLCFTVHFLFDQFHGRGDGDTLEWPPSPLRLYQALVSAASARWKEKGSITEHAAKALRWLEGKPAPTIIADGFLSFGKSYRLYVPDNLADKVASSWSRGNDKESIASYRTEKDIRPVHLKENTTVHYLFPTSPNDEQFELYREILVTTARSMTHLGWGIDMMVGNTTVISEQEASTLPGDRWEPAEDTKSTLTLRVPVQGTLDGLIRRYDAFLNRLNHDKEGNVFFSPVPALSCYKNIGYRRPVDPSPQPFAVFSLLRPDGKGVRAFDTERRATVVAGMVRHALGQLASEPSPRPFNWSDADIATIVLGHNPNQEGRLVRTTPDEPRFSYLPLPSIEQRGPRGCHVGLIRRVMVVGRPGMEQEITWATQALSGADLIEEHTGERQAFLSLLRQQDWVSRQYFVPSSVWTTVTPVVIPGYDDRSGKKTDKLLRKALIQAGFPQELVRYAELDWRGGGFLPGLALASQYRRPLNVKEAPVRHVTIKWRDCHGQAISIPGPIAIGSGRFRGLGLFVSTS